MPVTTPPSPEAPPADPLALCLCAAWCRTCEAYLPVLQGLASRHPAWQFGWLDVEDHADALAASGAEPALDIDTFPTLLILWQGAPRFIGPLPPQPGVLERLLEQAPGLPALADTSVQQLARNSAALAQQGRAALPARAPDNAEPT